MRARLSLGQGLEHGAGVQPLPGFGLPPNGVGYIARAEAGPGATEEPGAGQEVGSHPLAGQIGEGPTWPG